MRFSKFHRFLLFLIPFIFVLIALRNYLFNLGISLLPELMYSQNFFILLQNHLHAWDSSVSLGHSNLVYPEALGDRQIYGSIAPLSTIIWLFLLSLLQLSTGEFTQKIYFFFILLLPFICMIPLAKYWFRNNKNYFLPVLATILFYGANVTITGRFLAASMNHNLAVGLFPLIIYAYFKLSDIARQKNNIRLYVYYSLIGGLFLSFAIQLRVHFLVIFGIFTSIQFLYIVLSEKKQFLKKIKITIPQIIIPFLAILFVSVLLNIHQWLPLLYFKEKILEAPELIAHTLSMLLVSNDYVSILNSITLLSNIIGAKSLMLPNYKISIFLIALLFVPIIMSSFAVFIKKSSRKNFLGIIILISIILSSGLNSPFGEIFKWFYLNTPLLDPFRDPSKFLVLTVLGYSLLIGEFFLLFINKKRLVTYIFFLFIVFIFLTNPVFFSGDFFGNLENVEIPKSYYRLQQWTKEQKNKQNRIFLLPSKTVTFQYAWFPKNVSFPYSPNLFQGIFPLCLPLANTGWNNAFYGMRLYHFVDTQINQALPNLLWNINAKYIVTDTAFEYGSMYNQKLEKIPSIVKIKNFDNLTLYQNSLIDNDDIFIRFYPKHAYITGDASIATFSGKIPLVNFTSNIDIYKNNSDIFVYNRTVDDIVFESLFRFYGLNPVKHFIKSKGATQHDWSEGTGDINPYEKGLEIISSAPMNTYTTATIPLLWNSKINDNYIILARVGYNIDNGKISFLLDDKKIKTINLNSKYTGFTTINLGTYSLNKGLHTLKINNEINGKIVSVDGITIIPTKVFNYQKNKLTQILSNNGIQICTSDYQKAYINLLQKNPCENNQVFKNVVYENDNDIKVFFTKQEKKYSYKLITYEKINDTNYKLNNKKELSDGLLIFNQSYSPYWELDGKSSALTNFYANGFIINSKTKFNEINYKPEKLYKLGLYLVAFFYLIILTLLIFLFFTVGLKRSKPKNKKQKNLKNNK